MVLLNSGSSEQFRFIFKDVIISQVCGPVNLYFWFGEGSSSLRECEICWECEISRKSEFILYLLNVLEYDLCELVNDYVYWVVWLVHICAHLHKYRVKDAIELT